MNVEIIAKKNLLSVINNLQKKEGSDSTGQGLKNIIGRYRFFTTRKVEINETHEIFQVTYPLLQVEL